VLKERKQTVTAPSKGTIDVALQALREDAELWRGMAGEIEVAARVAGEMDFQAFHFSYIADLIGVTESYQQVQEKLIQLLGDGAANFRNVAQALNTAADGYEQDERNAVHRLKNVW